MKNLLVEAARASKLTDTTSSLSDSGSFDATVQEFVETANDSAPHDDGSALETHKEVDVLQLDDDPANWELAEAEDAVFEKSANAQLSEQELQYAKDVQRGSAMRAAAHIRYSPLICVLLAVASAASWLTYLQLAGGHDASALGASLVSVRDSAPVPEQPQSEGVERFRFIEADNGVVAVSE